MTLKPCPFCGNEVKIEIQYDFYEPEKLMRAAICCKCTDECLISMYTKNYSTKEEAIAKATKEWNTRV